MEAKNQDLAQREKGLVVYQVAGQDVRLSYNIVRNFLTKGNGQVTDQDLTQFIAVCKYNQLNPFLNEAYLVKFGNQPAQMIVSKEALFKRAEENKNYEGIQGGIIVARDGEIVELEGCFYLKTDTLLGGWARVYRSDRKFPIVARVNLDEYDKKQSTWNEKKPTMIAKVAKVQALREAFPVQLGAMYTQEEAVTIDFEEVKKEEIKKDANKTTFIEEVDFETVTPENKDKEQRKETKTMKETNKEVTKDEENPFEE
jgi:phage recombination protein Bet